MSGDTAAALDFVTFCLRCIDLIALANGDGLLSEIDGVAVIRWLLAGDGAIIDKGTAIFLDRAVVGQGGALRHLQAGPFGNDHCGPLAGW